MLASCDTVQKMKALLAVLCILTAVSFADGEPLFCTPDCRIIVTRCATVCVRGGWQVNWSGI